MSWLQNDRLGSRFAVPISMASNKMQSNYIAGPIMAALSPPPRILLLLMQSSVCWMDAILKKFRASILAFALRHHFNEVDKVTCVLS